MNNLILNIYTYSFTGVGVKPPNPQVQETHHREAYTPQLPTPAPNPPFPRKGLYFNLNPKFGLRVIAEALTVYFSFNHNLTLTTNAGPGL